MPETLFKVRWPDGRSETCYSPSSIISTHLEVGRPYAMSAFLAACRSGLTAASERVRQVYGGAGCARAAVQLSAIEADARRYEESDIVQIEHIGPQMRRSA